MMGRYRFDPAQPGACFGWGHLRRQEARAGHEVEVTDEHAAYILANYPGKDGGPSLVRLDDPHEAVADTETPAAPVERVEEALTPPPPALPEPAVVHPEPATEPAPQSPQPASGTAPPEAPKPRARRRGRSR